MSFARLSLVPCIAAILLLTLTAGAAQSYPGAYRALIVHASCDPTEPTRLRGDIAALPDVAAVDIINGCEETPAAAQLMTYDLVVSMSNDFFKDADAYGDALADFVDSGGVVVQHAYDNWDGSGAPTGPAGRFASDGYAPFIPGDNPNEPVTLGEFDASSPLMQGVTALATVDNTDPELAPGAVLVAEWSDGRNLIAHKGRVVSVSGYTGDDTVWSGDFGRLAINAVRWLGGQTLTVIHPAPGAGTVTTAPGDMQCRTFVCTTQFIRGTGVSVAGLPNKGFAFAGFSGDCAGPACSLTMDAPKTVTANFVRFAVLVHSKLKRNRKKGTAAIAIRVGGPGTLVLTGGSVKRRTRAPAAASTVRLPIVAKGRAAKRLARKGSLKLGIRVTFTPSAGTPAGLSRKVRLIRDPSRGSR